MRWFRRRNRDFINDKVHVLGSTMDPRWIPPSGALFAPHPHDAYQVTCLGCGAVTYHPQSCEAAKLRTIRVPSGPAPGSAPRSAPTEES